MIGRTKLAYILIVLLQVCVAKDAHLPNFDCVFLQK